MTKRVIDADALLEWIKEKCYSRTVPYIAEIALKNKVEELATPTPEPQESIFDADGWCYDLDKAPKKVKVLGCFYDEILGNYVGEFMVKDNKIIGINYFPLTNTPIAWRPLPKAPKGATNATDI